jgi:hypothetical protein
MDSGPPEYLMRKLAAAESQARRRPLPPAVYAILWLDAVLVVWGALALGGMPPALGQGASTWTWLALAGSTLTAAGAALSAFQLSAEGRSHAWLLLPAPAIILWLAGSGMGCLTVQPGVDVWGDTVAEAGRCLAFLLMISVPLLGLVLYMLWRAALRMPGRTLAMGALASAGAAAALLRIVHPHDTTLLDLGAHALSLAVLLGIGALAARLWSRQ